ncbi:MAG: DUF3179 domain-containing protein [Spirochaetaceae bacterium]|nr:DUF3179 domain-containing protein [Spirochaetaceae bacterium]
MQWKSRPRIRLTIVAIAGAILAGGAVLLVAAPAPGTAVTDPELLAEEAAPRGAGREFKTDFTRHTVPYSDVLSGGPPKDGIPSIDNPQFVSVADADGWLGELEPVVLVEAGGTAKAYPLQVLTWHEIVNDEVGGVPISVTFCPLCNTAIGFQREFDGQVLDFGTTGRLRYSNLIMYDRQTETWWQQATGAGIAGKYAGSQLGFYPANIVSWQDFRERYPDADVLSRDTGYSRSYGRNPYAGYDNINNRPFLYRGPRTPEELPPMARVLTVDLPEEAVAYPYETLETARVINDTVAQTPITLFWQPGTASALDSGSIAAGRDVGTGASFSRSLNGEVLDFEWLDGAIRDRQTASTWSLLGEATAGPLEGSKLEAVVSINHFWFSWAAFRPETRIYVSDGAMN